MPKHESPAGFRPIQVGRVVKAAQKPKGKLPALAPNSTRRHAENRYREQYGLIVICPSVAVQRSLYDALQTLTRCKLRVVTTSVRRRDELAAALRRDPYGPGVGKDLRESKARSQATPKSSGRGAWQGTGFGGARSKVEGA